MYLLSLFISCSFWTYPILRLDGLSYVSSSVVTLDQTEERGWRFLLETSQDEIWSAASFGYGFNFLEKLIPHPSDLREDLP